MAESIEDLLSHYAELLARGHLQRAAALAAGESADLTTGPLLALAAQVQEALRPASPNPAFLRGLHEGLVAVAANRMSARARLGRYVSVGRPDLSRILPRPGRSAASRRLSPVLGRSAAVALISLAAIWWLERP